MNAETVSLTKNNRIKTSPSILTKSFSEHEASAAYSFHQSFPGYAPTPLIELNGLAQLSGVSQIWIKDESHRFGLNAFKVLGASYAIAGWLADRFSINKSEMNFSMLRSEFLKNKVKDISFVTATDGNHGKGVAWTVGQLGCKAIVYMPEGTAASRFDAIKNLGADVEIIKGTHTDAVNLAAENANKYGWILIQDTAWGDYKDIPINIMRGYLSIWKEFINQSKGEMPTHVFIQCGVGSLPAAIFAYLVEIYGKDKPFFINVEPASAACVLESYINKSITCISGKMETIMAGLACDTPSSIAFNILSDYCDFFITCSDDSTVKGIQILGNQLTGDPKIISGESGAVTTGLIYYLMNDAKYKKIADEIHLNKNSKVMLISTEGDTDPEMYNRIISL